jgi:SAM-dependent methyltransferase
MSRRRIPGWLKRPLLPIWNRGHHFARRLGEIAGAFRHGRFGWCEVCGRFSPWLYQRRVISPRLEELWGLTPPLAEALARKESTACAWCGAKLRARRIAQVLLNRFDSSRRSRSLATWVASGRANTLRIAEINRIEGLHEQLALLPGLAFSDYGDDPSVSPGVPSEDLTSLSYPDESFDLVLTSETLEHVPDLVAALSEIHRILISGKGVHIFTVPMLPGVAKTFARTIVRGDGALERPALAIHHPGGDWGYTVFTEIGADFPEILNRAGFDVQLEFGPVRSDDLAQVWVARKRP